MSVQWDRIGRLRVKMTRVQALAVMQLIGDRRPSIVAVHDCGLTRIVLEGHEIHVDKLGNAVMAEQAAELKRLHEKNRPKRGRPRKDKAI